LATIFNRAALTYESNGVTAQTISNLASATILDTLSANKTSLSDTYRAGDTITYILGVTNTCCSTLPTITVTDDLGSNTPGLTFPPLNYNNDAQLYINGIYTQNITPDPATPTAITFTLPELSKGSTATIIYSATINDTAPLVAGATITNTATWTSGTCTVSDTHTLTAELYADLILQKTMCPNVICNGDPISYMFTLTNYGNSPATEVVLTDTFDPTPENITVSINGITVPTTEYQYLDGTLTLPYIEGSTSITVPAAEYATDPTTGVITIIPGTVNITVTGDVTSGTLCCGATAEPIIPEEPVVP